MNDDGAIGFLARGLFEFVSPAPVIGHGAAAEEIRIRIVEARVVDQNERYLAVHIDTGIVIPVVLRRHDAMADEHQRRFLEANGGDNALREHDDIDTVLQIARPAVARFETHFRGGRRRRDFNHRHLLQVGSVVSRQQPRAAELILQIRDRLALTLGTGLAAFHEIVS